MIKDGSNVIDQEIKSFLMIGQSNMAGRGEFSDVEPIDNEDCYMLRMGRWQKMSEPINPDRAIWGILYHSGVGLAASFADELAKHSGDKIGLIPCADGGTEMSQWMPGEVLFDHAVMQTKLAQRSSKLSGILWHQGENDCLSEEKIAVYKSRFIEMITAMRKELGDDKIPVLIGELSENLGERFGDRPKRLNKVFHEIENEIQSCKVISSSELTLKPDGLHFDARSYRVFGKRYFEGLLSL